MPHIRFDVKRLGWWDLVVAVASVTLMIGIVLPWFEFGDPGTGYFSFNSIDLRGWMYAPFFLSLVVLGSVVIEAMRLQARWALARWLIIVGACGVDLVLTLACFAKKAPGLNWDLGAYLSVIAAVAAVVGAAMSRSAFSATGVDS